MSNRYVAHIVVATTAHRVNDVRIFERECKTLARAGFRVTLVARVDDDGWSDGVRILGIGARRAHHRLDRGLRVPFRILQKIVHARPDVVHFHDPDAMILVPLVRLLGKAVVFDAHEDLPRQLLGAEWLRESLRKPAAAASRFVIRLTGFAASAVIVADPSTANRWPAPKTTIVRNFPDIYSTWDMGNLDAIDYGSRPNNVVYVGGLSRSRGAIKMVEAISLLSRADATLRLAGQFLPAEVEAMVRELDTWNRVEILGWLDRRGVRSVLTTAKIGLVLLQPTPWYMSHDGATKMFEYMAAGIPVIVSRFPEWEKIIDALGSGLTADPTDPADIAGCIEWLLEHPGEAEAMGTRGRAAVESEFNWEHEGRRLVDTYSRLVGS